MKKLAKISLRSVFGGIDPNRKENSFEVYNSYNRFLDLIL